MSARPLIGLLTDFGTRDWYVAAMKAVILGRCPSAQFIDITHNVPPQHVATGAFLLAAAVPWFPRRAVVVGVVDPGVGSARALLAAEADGRYLVGPDNGLLSPSLAQASRRRVVRLTQHRYWLPDISRTFHGRDILAPVAAWLACGLPLARLGVPAHGLVTLTFPPVRHGVGQVIHMDRFGNLVTNLPGALLAAPGVTVRYRNRPARVVATYSEGRPGELVALVGALGFIELAIREASAAERVGGSLGDRVAVSRATQGSRR